MRTGAVASRRGLALAAAGGAALLASRGFGSPALATFGAGLVALPLLVGSLVWLTAAGLRLERAVRPERCRAGDPVAVSLRLSGWPARAGLDRLLVVTLDPGLGSLGAGDGAVRRGPGRAWTVASAPRGDHALPPPRLRVGDPFGLARRVVTGAGGAAALVLPRAPALDRLAAMPGRAGTATGAGGRRTGVGDLDRIRDYRAGDPLSRVHWAQSAKRGRLQTKELREPAAAARGVALVLDGAVPEGEAFETAVTAAAAAARHLLGRGERVTLIHTGPEALTLPASGGGWPAVEAALARVRAGGDRSLPLAVRAALAGPEPPEAVVVVTAGAEAGLGAALARARADGVAPGAVLVGPAAASAPEVAAAGAALVTLTAGGDVAAALSAGERGAREA